MPPVNSRPDRMEHDSEPLLLVGGTGFSGWHPLNDTIMGGSSQGSCRVDANGLHFEGMVVEAGGGFVSMRSPLFSPPLDLSRFGGLNIVLTGEGRIFKLAVACADGLGGLTEWIPGGLRWVSALATNPEGVTRVDVRFDQLKPTLRAKPLQSLPFRGPLQFQPARISRLQLLHSRFGDDGGDNTGFRAGPISLTIHEIRAVP